MVEGEDSTASADTSKRSKNRRNGSSPRKPVRRTHSSGTASSPRSSVRRNHSSGTTSSPRKPVRRNHSSDSVSVASSITSLSCSLKTIDASGLSVVKILTVLRSQPPNRSCADCRSALIDPSTVYASLCVTDSTDTKNAQQINKRSTRRIALQDFHLTHRAFAPPSSSGVPAYGAVRNRSNNNNIGRRGNGNHRKRNDYDDDLAFSVNQRFGGHGVFICGRCAEAHRQLVSFVRVKRVTDSHLWTIEEAQFIATNGGNAQCWKIYEAYVPDQWKERRPIYASSLSARILFCRAKYEALAFCFPPPGPWARDAWEKILRIQRDKNTRARGSPNLKNISSLSLSATSVHSRKSADLSSTIKTKKRRLPNRLIDYFCVISSSMQLLPSKSGRKKKQKKVQFSNISSAEALDFWPHVTDCYPPRNTHGEMGYLDHMSSFVMPGGCHPTLDPKPPSFSTFVLTMEDGSYLYGGSLQIYDEHVDAEEIKRAMRDSGYVGEFPGFLMTNSSDVFFFPKCLVFLSRYAFFNLFRSVLLEIYQISLIAAPLPIERYVSNFVSEVPLSPQGQVKVEFSFATNKRFSIERPPINKLPMADFSYRPLFASLSVNNIIVVLGYLLQECKVVLLSEHFSLLTPVAEALLSAIFPFRWVGLYIPVAPLKMVDILDAPIPYIIGLNSEYFNMVEVRHRPKDAILVDLDRDVIHIGEIPLPKIPEHDVQKLTTSLEEAGGSVYVIPNTGIKGCIMAGSRKSVLVPNENRPRYAQMTTMTGLEVNSFYRDELFSICDLAYGRSDDEAERINGFGFVNGQLTAMEEKNKSNGKKKVKPFIMSPIKKTKNTRKKKANILSKSQSAMGQVHLLDMTEPEGFSVVGIRKAFLRFTVATFADYQDSLLDNSGRDLFDGEKFVEDVGSSRGSMIFLKKVLRSQLFQRFLEERKENPELPEIRFFDESIIAKRNRSKRETLAKGGKKPTPFLDDRTTWEVKKIFTPPSPNNLGLPDDEASYRYGIFPVLDATRFGRIRPAVKWRQHASLDSVLYTNKFNSKLKKSQNEIVKNALKPVLATPNSIAAAAKRTARDLESTLAALSIIPAKKCHGKTVKSPEVQDEKLPSSRAKVKTLSTADTIMMDARRKQGILLESIIQTQALCRGFLARNFYIKNRFEIIESKRNEEYAEWESQEQVRRQLEAKRLQTRIRNVLVIQRFIRMCLARKKKRRMIRAVIIIQSTQRSSSKRKKWKVLKDSAIVITKFVRARRAKIIFQEVRRMVTTIQSRVRGGLVRTKMESMMEQKMSLYTTQIFVLWTCLHVSLIFRAKMWPNISSGNGFLCLRLAELELLRLWDIASLSDRWNGVKCSDKISLYCDYIGTSNDVYYRSKKCADLIQSGVSIVSKHDDALRLEETERLHIYERLDSSALEKDISTLYRAFDIAADEKMKKVAFSKILWTKIVLADRSTTSMNFIFPELKNSLGISFEKPSSKGQRRFPNALKTPVPPIDHELWENVSFEETTKRHVQEVAMLFITKVPELSNKLDSICTSRDTGFDSFLRAVMNVKDFKSIKEARRCILQQYIYKSYFDETRMR